MAGDGGRRSVDQVTSYPDGKLVVEVLRDKFDGDSICVQCREKDNSWDRSGWVRCTFAEAEKQTKVMRVTFEDRVIGKEYEIRAKVRRAYLALPCSRASYLPLAPLTRAPASPSCRSAHGCLDYDTASLLGPCTLQGAETLCGMWRRR